MIQNISQSGIRRETKSVGGGEPSNLIFLRFRFVGTICHEHKKYILYIWVTRKVYDHD